MDDLPLAPAKAATQKASNSLEYSVSELSQAVKRTVETSFDFVRVRGEISRPTYARSGHLYFTLKDEKSVLDVVSWKGTVSKLSVRAEEGLQIIATGKLTTYPGSSKYQLVMSAMELAGEGALLKLLEMRKKQLAAEGLFAPERKQRLPFLPKRIGVVTSPTGAVIRDILHRVADRFPRPVMLWPVKVQGEGAAQQVARAIAGFNALPAEQRPDVLIVGRGGGSLEDLWAFNEEVVVRAIAQSAIPIVSAVGHETDTTLADFAADLRAPTPTGAAEQVVPVRQDLMLAIGDLGQRMDRGLVGLAARKQEQLAGLARGLPQPEAILEQSWQYLDQVSARLEQATSTRLSMASSQLMAQKLRHPREMLSFASQDLSREWQRANNAALQGLKRIKSRFDDFRPLPRLARANTLMIERRQAELANTASLLEAYQSVEKQAMARGYARVETLDGQVLTNAATAAQQSHLRLIFADASIDVTSAENGTAGAAQPPIVAQEQPHKSDNRGQQKVSSGSDGSRPKAGKSKKAAPPPDPSQGSLS